MSQIVSRHGSVPRLYYLAKFWGNALERASAFLCLGYLTNQNEDFTVETRNFMNEMDRCLMVFVPEWGSPYLSDKAMCWVPANRHGIEAVTAVGVLVSVWISSCCLRGASWKCPPTNPQFLIVLWRQRLGVDQRIGDSLLIAISWGFDQHLARRIRIEGKKWKYKCGYGQTLIDEYAVCWITIWLRGEVSGVLTFSEPI